MTELTTQERREREQAKRQKKAKQLHGQLEKFLSPYRKIVELFGHAVNNVRPLDERGPQTKESPDGWVETVSQPLISVERISEMLQDYLLLELQGRKTGFADRDGENRRFLELWNGVATHFFGVGGDMSGALSRFLRQPIGLIKTDGSRLLERVIS